MSEANTDLHPQARTILAIAIPLFGGGIIGGIASQFLTSVFENGVWLGAAGLVAVIMGVRWYGSAEMGLRGGRPLFASLGFATIGWVGILVAWFVTVPIQQTNTGLGITFLYLLICEAICVQLWVFGLFFRTFAEWRNPLIAAIISGIMFGLVAYFFFREATFTPYAVIYYIAMGVSFGFIRLRSGSLLGMAFVQAIQSLIGWYLINTSRLAGSDLIVYYAISGIVFWVVVWRLWPKYVSDFRV